MAQRLTAVFEDMSNTRAARACISFSHFSQWLMQLWISFACRTGRAPKLAAVR